MARRTKLAKPRAVNRPSAPAGPPKPSTRVPAASTPEGIKVQTRVGPAIVGIGASAGGLEALEVFLRRLPRRSGAAFVIVQHLDPQRKAHLVEVLQHASALPVVEITDGLRVEPDTVYVIPPNRDLAVLHGVLHLQPPPALVRIGHLPIDSFFRSLADDLREQAVAVLLSGMGTDGSLGMRAIKDKAGIAFVQSPASAKFDSMPRSAIDTGVADVVAPVEELPERILAYLARLESRVVFGREIDDRTSSDLDKIFVLMRSQTGNDFSLYKRTTILRRVERRMGIHQIDSLSNYVRFLRETPGEVDRLFKEVLIGVTSFFRDPDSWEHLRKAVLPTLFTACPSPGVLRAWVPGCSTGEEAYSLAIILREAMEQLGESRQLTFQIFATDLDTAAIDRARLGTYPANIVADVSPERLRRFFVREDHGYRVRKDIREMVIFAPQNVIMDPPFTKLDILSCRNLLIYLSSELQRKLIPLFHYSLNPHGVLVLGGSETIGGFSTLFAPMHPRVRLYRRLSPVMGSKQLDFPAAFSGGAAPAELTPETSSKVPATSLQSLADRILVQRFLPAAVLVSDKGDILYVSGRTGKYLEPASGRANWNVFAMAREGLRFELSRAFAMALRGDRAIKISGVKIGVNGGTQRVDVSVQRVKDPEPLRGSVMIVFTDVPATVERSGSFKPTRASRATKTRLGEAEQELRQAREEVHSIREEMQSSQEELKSTNEELQSTNEELQSSNEELTTSKEEMQSLNEELQTVNEELQGKVDELSRSSNDMKNLLNSTDIATLFLDDALLVRRFTPQTSKIIKLIPGDLGRPITDIVTELEYPGLAADALEVLRTLVFKEQVVSTRDGRWFSVRVMPYRTIDNVIDGVVVTFTEATASKKLEGVLREQADHLRQLAESLPILVWGCQADGACDYLSRQWIEYTGVPEAEQLGTGWLDQVHPDDRALVRERWRESVRDAQPFDLELRLKSKDGDYRWFKTRATPILDEERAVVRWYGTHTDIEDVKPVEERGSA